MKALVPAALLCVCLIGCRTNETPEAQVKDLQIVTQVKAKLISDIGPSTVANITVDSTNGVVTLAGQVDSSDVKAKAETVAKAIPKVVRVVNNLQIAAKTESGRVLNSPGLAYFPQYPVAR